MRRSELSAPRAATAQATAAPPHCSSIIKFRTARTCSPATSSSVARAALRSVGVSTAGAGEGMALAASSCGGAAVISVFISGSAGAGGSTLARAGVAAGAVARPGRAFALLLLVSGFASGFGCPAGTV